MTGQFVVQADDRFTVRGGLIESRTKEQAVQIPTVGRVVHFRFNQHAEPQAALITKVHSPVCINVAIFREDGGPLSNPPTSLLLLQEGQPAPVGGSYCEWPVRS